VVFEENIGATERGWTWAKINKEWRDCVRDLPFRGYGLEEAIV